MILNRIPTLLQNKLVFGSIFLFSATFIGNVFNAAFNFAMARVLGPSDYGDLMALVSILYITTFPSVVLNNVVTKFSAIFSAKSDFKSLLYLFEQVTAKTLLLGLVLVLGLGIFSDTLSKNLKIEHDFAILLVGVLSVLFFLITINLGLLNGLLRFKTIAIGQLLWPIARLVFSIGLVWLGYSVSGAVLGFVLSSMFAYLITVYPLRFLLNYREKEVRINWSQIGSYSIPAAFSLLGLTLLTNTDILLVKYFFSEEEAGIYSAGMLLAKIILFISLPIMNMVFPIITQAYESKKDFKKYFDLALGLTVLLSGGALVFFSLFPGFSTNLLFGPGYAKAASILTLSAVFIFLYSLVYLFSTLWLSIGRLRLSLLSLVGAGVQSLLIYLFHSSLEEVIIVNAVTAFTLVLINSFYYLRLRGNK